ncbi:DNA/RNA nuclease SfsA [Vagococcus elongatus]|uniref:Sugar fermentation stimulation protein homolog n=1 Tax=Vagococcus elongatus TaxID=180344 RepID=A0A430B4R5_9ENTE|nr:sugar fermentation stimulation protein SfsA [Vagococcus elongatus]
MVYYNRVELGTFIERPNRFVARCLLHSTNEVVTVHVKNTGRCKELLLENVQVGLSYQPGPQRKTDFDLISVKKGDRWVNIDSQVPNELAEIGLTTSVIQLPGLLGDIKLLQREKTFASSRFDIYLETDADEKAIIEVKGLTLEHNNIGAFPDAPSQRASKHVAHLRQLMTEGYRNYLLFIIQMENIAKFTIADHIDRKLYEEVSEGMEEGLQVLGYDCRVGADFIQLHQSVSFELTQKFG